MIRRWLKIWLRAPASKRAFGRLWQLHRSPGSRRQFLAGLGASKGRAHRLIRARWLLKMGQTSRAHKQLRALRKQAPSWHPELVLRLSLRCSLRLRLHPTSLAYFRRLWKSRALKPRHKRRLLKRVWLSLLKGSYKAGFSALRPRVLAQTWSAPVWAELARAFFRYGAHDDGLRAYREAIQRSKGRSKAEYTLAMLREGLRLRRTRYVLKQIAKARAKASPHPWFGKALLQLEVMCYRREGRLAVLVERLLRRWGKKRSYAQSMWIAQLFEELRSPRAWAEYRRALRLKPRKRKPRLRLIYWAFTNKRVERAHFHIARLIEYNRAYPHHYLRHVRYLMRMKLDRPQLERWDPTWRFRWRKCGKPRKRYTKGCIHQASCRALVQCKRTRWEAFRTGVWREWEQDALPKERRVYLAIRGLLRLCVQRFPRAWGALFSIEDLLQKLGDRPGASQTFEALLRATTYRAVQLKAVIQRLIQAGRTGQVRPLLLRSLQARQIPTIHAVRLAKLSLEPVKGPLGDVFFTDAKARKRWKRSFALPVRRLLKKTLRRARATPGFSERFFLQAEKLLRLSWQVGARNSDTRALLKAVLKSSQRTTRRHKQLLRRWIKAGLSAPLMQLFRQPKTAAHRRLQSVWLAQYPWEDGPSLSATFQSIRRAARGVVRHNPWPLQQMVKLSCGERSTCRLVRWDLIRLMRHTKLPAQAMIAALEAVAALRLFPVLRRRWIPRLLKRKPLREVLWARSVVLFADDQPLRTFHIKLLRRVFPQLLRRSTPVAIKPWSQLLLRYQRAFSRQKHQLHSLLCTWSGQLLQRAILQRYKRKKKGDPLGLVIKRCVAERRLPKRYFASLMQSKANRLSFFRFVLKHQIASGLKLLMKQLSDPKNAASILSLVRSLPQESKAQFATGVQRHCFRHIDRVSALVPVVVQKLCHAGAAMCQRVFRCFIPMMHSRNVSASRLVLLLKVAARGGMSSQTPYVAFLQRLIQYWQETMLQEAGLLARERKGLYLLSGAPVLFRSSNQALARRLGLLQVRLLLYHLKLRGSLPQQAPQWRAVLKRALSRPGALLGELAYPAFKRKWSGAKLRFPVVKAMDLWMAHDDKRSLRAWIRRMLGPKAPKKAPVAAALWLLELHEPGNKALDKHWGVWLRKHPKQSSAAGIKGWVKRCCVDALEQSMASRVLRFGVRKHGVPALRYALRRTLDQLAASQARQLRRLIGNAAL